MILDELIEKKDILIYIDMRSKVLDQEIKKELEITIPKNKEKILQRYIGRKKELKLLRGIVHDGNVKNKEKYIGKVYPKKSHCQMVIMTMSKLLILKIIGCKSK